MGRGRTEVKGCTLVSASHMKSYIKPWNIEQRIYSIWQRNAGKLEQIGGTRHDYTSSACDSVLHYTSARQNAINITDEQKKNVVLRRA